MPKQKNNGTPLMVRVSRETHIRMAQLRVVMLRDDQMPGYITNALIVENAIAFWAEHLGITDAVVMEAITGAANGPDQDA